MLLHIPSNTITFAHLQHLFRFDDELSAAVKSLLNATYPHLHVQLFTSLDPWDGSPARLRHNASPQLPQSDAFVDDVNHYLSTRDDIEEILTEKYTLIIKLIMSERATTPPANTPQKQEEQETIEFFPVKPKYHFEQIILEEPIRKEIFDAMKVIQCKDLIYHQWGFDEVDPVPRSILNFYGEPGTGKTMCAHAIAHYLGKDILALNYSEIESKYVGEAPKNLQKAFDAAREHDAVLFFDEADSFLGKRIENVTQGADQALNSLRSQMLIQLEEFSGVVLFATNLVTNFDPAFESRILKHIHFQLPNLEARAAIIKKMIPTRLPVDVPFTDEQYAEASALIDGFSGREIKGAILDLILSKADTSNPHVLFTIQDLYDVLTKKQQAKKELKAEEERRLKLKIEKKLKEKAAEADALKKAEAGGTAEVEDSAEAPVSKDSAEAAVSADSAEAAEDHSDTTATEQSEQTGENQ